MSCWRIASAIAARCAGSASPRLAAPSVSSTTRFCACARYWRSASSWPSLIASSRFVPPSAGVCGDDVEQPGGLVARQPVGEEPRPAREPDQGHAIGGPEERDQDLHGASNGGRAVLALHRARRVEEHGQAQGLGRAAARGGHAHGDPHEVALLHHGVGRLLRPARDLLRHRRLRVPVAEGVVELLRADPGGVRQLAAGQRLLRQPEGHVAHVQREAWRRAPSTPTSPPEARRPPSRPRRPPQTAGSCRAPVPAAPDN